LRKQLNALLRLYNGKTPTTIKQLAATEGHPTYEELLEEASLSYQRLVETNLWGPVDANKDKGRAPEGYITQAEANTLIQKTLAKNGNENTSSKELTCYGCGKKGHRHSDCPNKKGKDVKADKKRASWKSRLPKSGEPETKTFDSMEWHLFAKFSLWRVGHGTAAHKDNYEPPAKPIAAVAEANTVETEELHATWGNLCVVD
jgi:hypothetical protein